MGSSYLDSKGVIIVCGKCRQKNRTSYARLGDVGNCGRCHFPLSAPNEPIEVGTVAQFDALIAESPMPVLVNFWAPWCGPCKAMALEIVKVATSNVGNYLVVKVDTDVLSALGERYKVEYLPTMALFRDGREMNRIIGARQAVSIQTFLNQTWNRWGPAGELMKQAGWVSLNVAVGFSLAGAFVGAMFSARSISMFGFLVCLFFTSIIGRLFFWMLCSSVLRWRPVLEWGVKTVSSPMAEAIGLVPAMLFYQHWSDMFTRALTAGADIPLGFPDSQERIAAEIVRSGSSVDYLRIPSVTWIPGILLWIAMVVGPIIHAYITKRSYTAGATCWVPKPGSEESV